MSNFALESLLTLRLDFIARKEKSIQEWDKKIEDVDKAIKIIEGGSAKNPSTITLYDDENPDYIRNSEDGI